MSLISYGYGNASDDLSSLEGIPKAFGPKNNGVAPVDVGDAFNGVPLPGELTAMFLPNECKLCEVKIESPAISYSHYNGKTHFKKVNKFLRENFNINQNYKKNLNQNFNPQDCVVCGVYLSSYIQAEQHFAGKLHQKNLKNPRVVYEEPGWLKPQTEEVAANGETKGSDDEEGTGSGDYYCELCDIYCNTDEQLQIHKKGTKHYKNVTYFHELVENEKKICKIKLKGDDEKAKKSASAALANSLALNTLYANQSYYSSGVYYDPTTGAYTDCNGTYIDPSTIASFQTGYPYAATDPNYTSVSNLTDPTAAASLSTDQATAAAAALTANQCAATAAALSANQTAAAATLSADPLAAAYANPTYAAAMTDPTFAAAAAMADPTLAGLNDPVMAAAAASLLGGSYGMNSGYNSLYSNPQQLMADPLLGLSGGYGGLGNILGAGLRPPLPAQNNIDPLVLIGLTSLLNPDALNPKSGNESST